MHFINNIRKILFPFYKEKNIREILKILNAERKNGWEHIFTNNNDEKLYIKILDPKSNKRYRSFETKLYTNEEVIQKTRKIDCKEKRIYFPSKFKWISVSQNSLTIKMYKKVWKREVFLGI